MGVKDKNNKQTNKHLLKVLKENVHVHLEKGREGTACERPRPWGAAITENRRPAGLHFLLHNLLETKLLF